MTDIETTRRVESVIRAVASAGKALKLYPPSSPIPQETVAAAVQEIASFFDSYPVLSLAVVREGFTWSGTALAGSAPGVVDLAKELREQGIAEVDFMPECTAEDIVGFLQIVSEDPEKVREEGGPSTALVSRGVDGIRVTDVHLTVIEEVVPDAGQDIEEFLRSLAEDPSRLAAWLAAASTGDKSTFREGLEELAGAVGRDGLPQLMRSLAEAFAGQQQESKDALLDLSFDPGLVRDLAAGMLRHLASPDIASTLCGGLFGQNMLSLSHALAALPLEERLRQVYGDVCQMLPGGGHGDKELQFLEHMMEIRARTEPEPALVDSQEAYRKVAAISDLSAQEIAEARGRASVPAGKSVAGGARIMLRLLSQHQDFNLYVESIDRLACMVPRLVDDGEMSLALQVINELVTLEARAEQPWPELTGRLRQALAAALGKETMASLLDATIADPEKAVVMREFVKQADESSLRVLAEEAVARKEQGLEVAEQLIGKRLSELLLATLPTAQWFQLRPIVEYLARQEDPRAAQAIESLLARHDEQSRREVAQGMASSGGPAASRLLARLLRDESADVAIISVRAVVKNRMPSGATLLSDRLAELDIDNKDFVLAREIIGGLARLNDQVANETLRRLSSRRALIKRGHFAEVQELVRQALQLQAGKSA